MAASSLKELAYVLSSKPEPERITPEEVNIILGCQTTIRKSCLVGLCCGAAVFAATKRLRVFARANVSVVATACAGYTAISRSTNWCVDNLLGLDGTRIQKELANIIVKGYQGEQWKLKLMSKHFYSELVYADASDKPQIRWRPKKAFTETNPYSKTAEEADSETTTDNTSQTILRKVAQLGPVSLGAGTISDPFDSVFGCAEVLEESHHPISSTTEGRVLTRNNKRSRRRRRNRQQDASLNVQYT